MATSVLTSYFPITDGGEVLVGARVFICDVGTTNLKSIYSDTALSSALDNPMDTDADGFHPQAYLSGSYKIRIETGGTDTIGSGTLIRQWDNIDGGVPVGSGDLPVADGGTGASTAAAARTNLGVPAQTEVDDLSAELAELAGTVGSTGATQLATGTTAQRPTDLANGQIRRNTSTARFEGYNGSGWENVLTSTEIASAAEMETGTDLTKVATPGRIGKSPGVPKAWVAFNNAGVIIFSHGVSSVVENSTGNWTITWSTAFSAAESYVGHVTLVGTSGVRVLKEFISAQTTTTMTVQTVATVDGSASETGITRVHVTVLGDQ
jgi:hypothetical protein